jgi:hypothetical protein
MIRVATTNGFKAINDWAVANGMNRSAMEDLYENLDEEALHIGQVVMHHTHKGGQPTSPHYRTVWSCGLKDEQRARVYVDIDPVIYGDNTEDPGDIGIEIEFTDKGSTLKRK